MLVSQSCFNSLQTPWTAACQSLLSMEVSRWEFWVELVFLLRMLPTQELGPTPALQADSLPHSSSEHRKTSSLPQRWMMIPSPGRTLGGTVDPPAQGPPYLAKKNHIGRSDKLRVLNFLTTSWELTNSQSCFLPINPSVSSLHVDWVYVCWVKVLVQRSLDQQQN